MMKKILLALLAIGCWVNPSLAQNDIEGVDVEIYYISDSNDETDTDGGFLEEGSTTYRVFVDLAPDAAISALYADPSHKFRMASTAVIFNNEDRGEALGFSIPGNRLNDNTVALDSWITIGGASDDHVGITKDSDTDGSIVGGANNDGGSQGIAGGLLVNADANAGQALTASDGLIADASAVPLNFFAGGTDPDTSSVLLDMNVDTLFESFNMNWSAPQGVKGIDTVVNRVLVAQITTKGDLMFNMNVRVLKDDGTIIDYIWGGPTNNDEVISGFLSYPATCGCNDPSFLEFDPTAGCLDSTACITPIVFGCLDTNACNYDPAANFNVTALCCWGPDSCNGLDPQLVCPGVGIDEFPAANRVKAFPNPFSNELSVVLPGFLNECIDWSALDISGRHVLNGNTCTDSEGLAQLQLGTLNNGSYLLTFASSEKRYTIRVLRE